MEKDLRLGNLIKLTFSPEQMKYLESLGHDSSGASMVFVMCPMAQVLTAPQVNEGQWEPGDVYTYTGTDALHLLERTGLRLSLEFFIGTWRLTLGNQLFEDVDQMEVLYGALVWAIKEKLLK